MSLPSSLPARPNVSIRGGSVQPSSPPYSALGTSAIAAHLPQGRKITSYDDLAPEEGELKETEVDQWEKDVEKRRKGREDQRRWDERDRGRILRERDRWDGRSGDRWDGERRRESRLSPHRSPPRSLYRRRSFSRSPRRRPSYTPTRSRSPPLRPGPLVHRSRSRSRERRSSSFSPVRRLRSRSPVRHFRSRSRGSPSFSRSRSRTRSICRSVSSHHSTPARTKEISPPSRSRSPSRTHHIPTAPKKHIPTGPKRQHAALPAIQKKIIPSRPIGIPPPNAPTGPREHHTNSTQMQNISNRSLAKGIVVKKTLAGVVTERGGEKSPVSLSMLGSTSGTSIVDLDKESERRPSVSRQMSMSPVMQNSTNQCAKTTPSLVPLPPGAIPAGPRAMRLPPIVLSNATNGHAPQWLRDREQVWKRDSNRETTESPTVLAPVLIPSDDARHPIQYTKSITITSAPPTSLNLHITGDENVDRELVKVAKEREQKERSLLKPFKWIVWEQLFPVMVVSDEEKSVLFEVQRSKEMRMKELRIKVDSSLRALRSGMIGMDIARSDTQFAIERRLNAEACLEKMGGNDSR